MIMDADTVAIFISPHLDDAILSCGGYINHLNSQRIKVIIATVFTADYNSDAPLSELAQSNLRKWGLGAHPFAKRCEEDRLAASRLGAEILHLDFQDCIFRQDSQGNFLYTQRVIDVPVHSFDHDHLVPALKKSLDELLLKYSGRNVRIFCPLGLGAHVDHILVRIAVELVGSPERIAYYEEFPYTLRPNASGSQIESMDPRVVSLSETDLQARLTASAMYISQIPGLFPSRWETFHQILDARLPASRKIYPIRYNVPASIKRMDTFIRKYSETIGGERYWIADIAPIVLEGHGS
jgi:LmbE family N-acetylglucosaminyl deacetylase